jgi:hypothetical protein
MVWRSSPVAVCILLTLCFDLGLINSVVKQTYRLPVVDYWLDIFEKVKALGLNAVSFYVHWVCTKYSTEAQRANQYLITRNRD